METITGNSIDVYVDRLKKMAIHKHVQTGYHFTDDNLAIEMEFGILLMDAIRKENPKTIVELGTGHGYSTSWIMLGNTGGEIYTFDHEDRTPYCWNEARILTIGLNVLNTTKFEEYLPKEIDFFFHDSQHKFELITPDLENIIPFMSNKSQIWIHDAKDELGKQLKEWFLERGWGYRSIEDSCGMGIASR